MADNRTMAQMLQAPIEGYEDAIVVPPINANNLEGDSIPSGIDLTLPPTLEVLSSNPTSPTLTGEK
ncbi:hypothetical protein Tco_1075702, partial [Tanacetum coccineum]